MANTSLPSVGFDRFIELSWADYALDLAVSNGKPEQLKDSLDNLIDGEVSARKTFNLLNNLWLRSFSETEQIRTKALLLVPKIPQQNRIILHWGMALANFELFQKTTSNMGKLLRLQGGFNRKEVQQRMSEVYSNQGTIPRAVTRIIQSLCQWNLVKENEKNSYTYDKKFSLEDDDTASWLLQAALNQQRSHPISLLEVFRLPELFPFEFNENRRKLIRESPAFTVLREGLNQEYVVLS